MISWLENQKAF